MFVVMNLMDKFGMQENQIIEYTSSKVSMPFYLPDYLQGIASTYIEATAVKCSRQANIIIG